MDSNRNTVLQVIVLGVAFAGVLVFGFAGCKTGAETKATQEPAETQAQPQANEKTARLENENAELRQKVAKLEQDNEALQKKVQHLETLVKEIVDPAPLLDRTPAIEAIVQKVDNELKFVVLSVGSDDKVSKGMRLYISRDDSYVGEVRVDVVYRKWCASSFVLLKPGMNIQVGDTAVTRL